MVKNVNRSKRMISKSFMVKGQRKRARVPVYGNLNTAIRELGELRVLNDINNMNIQRARWVLAARSKSSAP
jgi:hypothetical protein